MKRSGPPIRYLKPEEMKAVQGVMDAEGEILQALKDANEGHNPLWPEEQYGGSVGATDKLPSIEGERDDETEASD